MNELLPFLPEKWRPFALAGLAALPYFTRAIYRLRCGGGLRGVMRSIWLGDNSTPPKTLPLP